MYFEELMSKIRRNVNTGNAYFMEREFPEFDKMPFVWIKLNPEMSKLVLGFIDDMRKLMGRNYWV